MAHIEKFILCGLTNAIGCVYLVYFHNKFCGIMSGCREGPERCSWGYDDLLKLKRDSTYQFFHGSLFPGQGTDDEVCYIFKMSTQAPASGVDLVNRMRRGSNGDLCHSWVCFNHTHRVKEWVTMACHVYDPRYVCKYTIFWEHM